MGKPSKLLAPEKLRLIQVARNQLGMEEAAYRSLLMRAAGVSSSRDLTDTGFRVVMDEFGRLGFQSDSNRKNLGRRPGFATAGQVASIRRLWAEYTGAQGTEAQLGQWLEKTWHVSALRFLTAEQGPKAITALKAMCSRRRDEATPVSTSAHGLTPEQAETYRAMRRERRDLRLPETPDELLSARLFAGMMGWAEEHAERFLGDAYALMAEPEPPMLVYDVGPRDAEAPDLRVSLASLPTLMQLFWHQEMLRARLDRFDPRTAHLIVIEAAEMRRRYAPT